MSFEIRLVKGFETLPLRQKILKPFASEAECAYPDDNYPTTFHFALFLDGDIKGVSTFIQQEHPDFPARTPYRLRGMAVDKDLQGQGLGKKLLAKGIEHLTTLECDFIWFNAREVAFPFYESLGFTLYGPMFDLPQIGPHKVMYKRFDPR
ncbi:acetyltransferase [Bdellovibrio bacteriovorus]|uniref:Acetyltransferase n=1 Tax=Bdellovibrio bacteriovorus TaxID=959 RepID=A0A150WRQ9_BDEBC|nr:acetyltransferase [Bdellovibrio bacteriovorus]